MRFCMVTTFYPPRHVGGDAVPVQSLARARLDAHSLRSAAIRRRRDSAGVRAWPAWHAARCRLRGRA